MNKILGIIGTTLGGGMVGAGIQRTYFTGNKIASALSKLAGNSGVNLDRTTWILLICGVLVFCAGVYYTNKKR